MLAAGAVAIIFVVSLALQQILGDTAIFILFVPVILVSAIAGGIGPGILALALSLAGALYIAGIREATWVQSVVFSLV